MSCNTVLQAENLDNPLRVTTEPQYDDFAIIAPVPFQTLIKGRFSTKNYGKKT